MKIGVAKERQTISQNAFRFLIAGGIASFANWLVRFPLSLMLPFGVAVAVAYVAGMIVGYQLYRFWVFPGSDVSARAQLARFICVNLIGFFVTIFTAALAIEILNLIGVLPSLITQGSVHALAIATGAVVNFFGHKFVSFARIAAIDSSE